jgi:hypothetical protein
MLSAIWGMDWMLGVPTTLILIAFHVSGIGGIEWILRGIDRRRQRARTVWYFLMLVLLSAILLLSMHCLEAGAWAGLYWRIGALGDFQTSLLYSLNAFTSYGHENTQLSNNWRLLGAIESMNGVMIFGLTTAFLFNTMLEFRPVKQAL